MLRYVCSVTSCEYSWCQHPFVCVPCKSVTRRYALYSLYCALVDGIGVSAVETSSFCARCCVCMFSIVFSPPPVELIFRCTPCLWHTEMLDLLRTKVFIGRWGGYCWCCCFLSTVYRVSHVSIVKVVQLILIALFCWKVILRQTLVNRDTRNI